MGNGITPADITLEVTPGSVVVTASVSTPSEVIATAAASVVSTAASNTTALTVALGVTIESITQQPSTSYVLVNPSPTSPPPTPISPPPRQRMSATDTASTWYSIVASFFGENLSDGVSSLLPAIRDHLLSITGIWFWLLLLICCCICPYWCFQKHYLPVSCGKVVGRAYFRPCLPCTIYSNKWEFKGKWYAYVDDGVTPVPGGSRESQANRPPVVILGQAPIFKQQLAELEALGITGIINLCDEFKGNTAAYRRMGMSLLWLRTIDHHEPTVPAMRTAIAFIEHHRKRGNGVYIHCKSGRGRSAAIAMGWLLQVRKMKPLEANTHLMEQRRVRAKLFLQKNIIQFYDELQEEMLHTDQGAGGGRYSFATPWNPNMRGNSTEAQRDVLQGGGAAPATPRGGAGGLMRTMSIKAGAAVAGMFGQGGGGYPGPPADGQTGYEMSQGYGYGAAPPDWDQVPANGMWEVNVAPQAPSIPMSLPMWAQQEQQQYDNSYQQAQPGGGRFSLNLGFLSGGGQQGGQTYGSAAGPSAGSPMWSLPLPPLPPMPTPRSDPQNEGMELTEPSHRAIPQSAAI